jgi:hypothetical protein
VRAASTGALLDTRPHSHTLSCAFEGCDCERKGSAGCGDAMQWRACCALLCSADAPSAESMGDVAVPHAVVLCTVEVMLLPAAVA